MFTSLGLKAAILAVVVAVSFGGGVWVRGAFCDSAAQKLKVANLTAQIAILQTRIATVSKAAEADKAQSARDAAEVARLQKLIDETPANDGACLDEGAAGRIGGVR